MKKFFLKNHHIDTDFFYNLNNYDYFLKHYYFQSVGFYHQVIFINQFISIIYKSFFLIYIFNILN
jgi:hypothetical protein